ncbi:MAG: hypothetical protein HQ546_09495 [Planctomycetes bacterium]|nr:hypothetical protein [Planctomycetota bacterium]
MIQCKDCEFFHRDDRGHMSFTCDPFVNVKEPECVSKWQLIKIDQMVQAYQATLNYYRKLAPMQEKMFKVMERELDDINEADRWKIDDEQDDGDDEGEDKDDKKKEDGSSFEL